MDNGDVKEILVLGVGNILLRDDGLGVAVVNEIIGSEIEVPDNVELCDGGTLGFDLLNVMTGRKKIIIVDALKIDDEPGSIYHFPAEHLAGERRSFSLHDAGVSQVIDSLKLFDEEPVVEIIGVVPEDIATFDMGLSGPVKKAVPEVIDTILKAVS